MRGLPLSICLLLACGGGDPDVSRLIGAQCEVADDCEERCLTPSNDYPDGFCTVDCSFNDDCPSATDCVDRDGGVCLYVCLDDVDCDFLGPAWRCQEANLREDQNVKVNICRGD
jgi:hypothetical protein